MLKALDLFSGIGGFALGMQWTGQIETVAFCDPDPFCQAVLDKNFPGVPIYDDVRTLPADLGAIDIVCGGFPCQPVSSAGLRLGAADDRWLWPAMLAQIQRYRPRFVMAENVTGLVSLGLDEVLSDLESEGYAAGAVVLPACAVGAPHRRDRVFILAHRPGCRTATDPDDAPEHARAIHDESLARVAADLGSNLEPHDRDPAGFLGADDGLPYRLDRLRVLGNAVFPDLVFWLSLSLIAGCLSPDEIHR